MFWRAMGSSSPYRPACLETGKQSLRSPLYVSLGTTARAPERAERRFAHSRRADRDLDLLEALQQREPTAAERLVTGFLPIRGRCRRHTHRRALSKTSTVYTHGAVRDSCPGNAPAPARLIREPQGRTHRGAPMTSDTREGPGNVPAASGAGAV